MILEFTSAFLTKLPMPPPASLATGGRSKGWLTNLTSDSGCRQHSSPNVISASSKLKLTIHTIPTSKLSSQGSTGQSAKSQTTTWRYRPSAVINMSAATPSWLSARNHWMRFPEDRRLRQASEGLSTHFCSLACSCETHLMHSSLSSNPRRTQHILPRIACSQVLLAWHGVSYSLELKLCETDGIPKSWHILRCTALPTSGAGLFS
jgi:hypothetical protein